MNRRGVVLWWGRSDSEYARNRILRDCLVKAGFRIVDFRPRVSATAALEATLRVREPVDLVWVPCFRQRDVAAARNWSERRGVPLIFDPLISAYDKQVFERGKFAHDGFRGKRLLSWERNLFSSVDMLLADTDAHAEFFHQVHGLPNERISVVPLCADERLFKPQAYVNTSGRPIELLFFGSFIPLQGPQVIIEAANTYEGAPVRWSFLGDGPLRAACQAKVRPDANVQFEDWMPYSDLPSRIARADIVLGIFGDTQKSARVIPNKFCQALACARPVVTRASPAYPPELIGAEECGVTWVSPGDPRALRQAVAALASEPHLLEDRQRRASETYQRFFSFDRVEAALADALGRL